MQAQGFLKFSLPNQTEWHEGILSSQGPESEQRFWMKPFGGQAMGFSFKESESIQIQPISNRSNQGLNPQSPNTYTWFRRQLRVAHME